MVTEIGQAQVDVIGSAAHHLLAESSKAIVFNQISRGIFIQLWHQQLIFLSYDAFRGPLTLNVDSRQLSNAGHRQGDPVDIIDDQLRFLRTNISLSLKNAQIWFPRPIAANLLSDQDRSALISRLADAVMHNIPPERQSIFHSSLLRFSNEEAYPFNDGMDINPSVEAIKKPLQMGLDSSLAQNLKALLGLGNGLTPSGDDFVLGFLLTVNRWFPKWQPGIDCSSLNESIIDAAYQRTTTLSANLIECACSGLADERLIAAVDFLATGEGSLADVLKGILSWGSSSGVEATIGMMTALEP